MRHGSPQTSHNKDNLLSGALDIAVDFSKLGCISDKRYGEPLGETIFVCGFEKAFSAGQLIDSGYLARSVINCIE